METVMLSISMGALESLVERSTRSAVAAEFDKRAKVSAPLPSTGKNYTRKGAADYLKCSLKTLANWEARGLLRPSRIGRRVLFSQEELDRALKSE